MKCEAEPMSVPGEIRVFPLHEKASVPMLKSIVVCRYLQS